MKTFLKDVTCMITAMLVARFVFGVVYGLPLELDHGRWFVPSVSAACSMCGWVAAQMRTMWNA